MASLPACSSSSSHAGFPQLDACSSINEDAGNGCGSPAFLSFHGFSRPGALTKENLFCLSRHFSCKYGVLLPVLVENGVFGWPLRKGPVLSPLQLIASSRNVSNGMCKARSVLQDNNKEAELFNLTLSMRACARLSWPMRCQVYLRL